MQYILVHGKYEVCNNIDYIIIIIIIIIIILTITIIIVIIIITMLSLHNFALFGVTHKPKYGWAIILCVT